MRNRGPRPLRDGAGRGRVLYSQAVGGRPAPARRVCHGCVRPRLWGGGVGAPRHHPEHRQGRRIHAGPDRLPCGAAASEDQPQRHGGGLQFHCRPGD